MRANLLLNLLIGLCVLAMLSVAVAAGSRSIAATNNNDSCLLNVKKKSDMPWEVMARQLMGSVSL